MKIYINDEKEIKSKAENNMESYIRHLECEIDLLHDQNDSLREELEKAAEMRADEALAELKREFLEDLEKMPAEKVKKGVIDLISAFFLEE